MICSDQLNQQSAQAHRLVLLVAEVLDEEETVLVVSGFLVTKVTTLHESAMLDKEEEMVFWLFGCDLVLLGPFLLAWLGWGHRHLFGHFWSSSICQFAVTTTKGFMSKDIEKY